MFRWPQSLWWAIPIAYGTAVLIAMFFLHSSRVSGSQQNVLLWFIMPVAVIAPIGGWWAVYQCIRYEKNLGKYLAIVLLVPLGCFWYYQERYTARNARNSA